MCAVKSWLLLATGLPQSAAMFSLMYSHTLSRPEGWHMLFLFLSFQHFDSLLSSLFFFTWNQKLNKNFNNSWNIWMIFTAGNYKVWPIGVQSISKWTVPIFVSHRDDYRKRKTFPLSVVQSSCPLLSYQCQISLKGFKRFDLPSIRFSTSKEQQGNDRFKQWTAYPCNQRPDSSIAHVISTDPELIFQPPGTF